MSKHFSAHWTTLAALLCVWHASASTKDEIPGTYRIMVGGSGRVLNVDAEDMITTAKSNDDNASLFTIYPDENGYRIKSEANGWFWSLPAEGDLLLGTWKYSTDNDGLFKITKNDDGSFSIESVAAKAKLRENDPENRISAQPWDSAKQRVRIPPVQFHRAKRQRRGEVRPERVPLAKDVDDFGRFYLVSNKSKPGDKVRTTFKNAYSVPVALWVIAPETRLRIGEDSQAAIKRSAPRGGGGGGLDWGLKNDGVLPPNQTVVKDYPIGCQVVIMNGETTEEVDRVVIHEGNAEKVLRAAADRPVSLFKEQYTVPTRISSIDIAATGTFEEVPDPFLQSKTRGKMFAQTYPAKMVQLKQIDEIPTYEDSVETEVKGKSTAESELLEVIREFNEDVSIDFDTVIGEGGKPNKSSIRPGARVKIKKGGQVTVYFYDRNSQFRNQVYEKTEDPPAVGFFLERLTIRYETGTDGWDVPVAGPALQNKTSDYSHDTSISLDIGVEGKQGTGSFGWSQSESSGTAVADFEYTLRSNKNGEPNPIFEWEVSNVYDGKSDSNIYEKPSDIVKRTLGEVVGVLSAPVMAQGTFEPVAYAAWSPKKDDKGRILIQPGTTDFRVVASYTATYRIVTTKFIALPDGAPKIYEDQAKIEQRIKRGMNLLFVPEFLTKGDLSYMTDVNDWSTTAIRQTVNLIVVIPKESLRVPKELE